MVTAVGGTFQCFPVFGREHFFKVAVESFFVGPGDPFDPHINRGITLRGVRAILVIRKDRQHILPFPQMSGL